MVNRGDIFWLKSDAPVPVGKEFLLDHRLVILRVNSTDSLVTSYEAFKIGSAYDANTGRIKSNKYFDEESQEIILNDNPSTKMNEPIYPNELNNLAHTSYVDCLYSFTIPNEWLEENRIGSVSPNQIDSFEELNIMQEVGLDIIDDERIIKESFNVYKSLNPLDTDFIYDTYVDNVNCIVTIGKTKDEFGREELSYGWYDGNVVVYINGIKRKLNFALNVDDKVLNVSGSVRKFQISYDIETDELFVKYNEYEKDLPNIVVNSILNALDESGLT